MGRAHLLISNMYASSANNCGTSQFDKRAVYWLAEKEARKAARIDVSIRKMHYKLLKVTEEELLQKQIFYRRQIW